MAPEVAPLEPPNAKLAKLSLAKLAAGKGLKM